MAHAPETDYQTLLRLGEDGASGPFQEGAVLLLAYYEREGKMPICPREGIDEDTLLDDSQWTPHWYKCPVELKSRLEALSFETHYPAQMVFLLVIRMVIAAHWKDLSKTP